MHVLMSSDAVGGVWHYGLDLASGLCARGHTVTMAVLGPAPSADQARSARAIAGCRLVALPLPLDWTAGSVAAAREASTALARFARSVGADVAHLHTPALLVGDDFTMPTVAVCHSCVATWWDAVGSGPLPADLAWRRDLAKEGCHRASALLAPTEAFAVETARLYQLAHPPIVIHNGRRLGPTQPRTLAASAPFVFTAGRLWDRAKNAVALDRVAARLSFPVLAAGSLAGPNGDRLALDHVEAVGHLSDNAVAAHLGRRPIFVSLARYEPFGLAVLEAAQAGCALVLSDIPTFRELWDGAATFVDPEDDAGIARMLEGLAGDGRSRTRLGAAARTRAGRYSAEAMTDGVLGVFHALPSLSLSKTRSRASESVA